MISVALSITNLGLRVEVDYAYRQGPHIPYHAGILVVRVVELVAVVYAPFFSRGRLVLKICSL